MADSPTKNPFVNTAMRSISKLQIPAMNFPEMTAIRIPTPEQRQKFESAGVLVTRLAERIRQWTSRLPKNQQPVVLAVLANGTNVNVHRLSQESHHGILIEGDVDGSPCMVLCHQETLQLLCYVEEIQKEEQRRVIGFNVNGTA